MEHNSFGCQICLIKCKRISDFKEHVSSHAHHKKMEEVFQTGTLKGLAFMPNIIFRQPVLGLSLLSLCFSPETKIFFYLCYVCEEKVASDRITSHLCSRDHCSNYFTYTDPDVLSFAWLPSMDMRVILKAQITKEAKEKGPGQLQMLELPENLLKKLEPCTYSEVMGTLSENKKLMKLHKASKPKRTMIQTYQRDSNRKHPLLGMKHIVECICAKRAERKYYLCTLCNLTLATHMIIKHVLSFDHIFCYFKAWHPSTLLSKECYRNYTKSFTSMILDFAKQTEEIHGTANSQYDMMQVILKPDQFKSVNFTSYAEALKELKSITKDESLIANIKPGNKLVLKEQESIKKEDKKSLSTSIEPGNKPVLKEQESIKKEDKKSLSTSIEPGNKPECRTVSAELYNHRTSYKLRCQNCSVVFETIYQYANHLSERKHIKMSMIYFGQADSADGSHQTGYTPFLGLYKYIKECLKMKSPAVGVALVVTCVTTQVHVEPFYVCFACEDCFYESSLRQHFSSRKHLIHTLLYQNPWRLPFAWDNCLDFEGLRSMAWEEEKERGPNEMMVKVLHIPYSLFSRLCPSYPEVMKTLELHHTVLRHKVPRCETYSKLKQNERFPLLGQQFLVMHYVCVTRFCESTETGFLCLLCQRRLSDVECYAHVFSREHVTRFLERFHPGSLNSSADAEAVLDLAKQAANIHSISHVQVIQLERPIWEPCSYNKASSILAGAKKRLGHGKLQPPIFPKKKKLVPRETLKKESQENIRIKEESEKKTSQNSTDNNETTLKKITVESGAESGDKAGKGANKETPTPSENDSERRAEVASKTTSEIKNATSQTIKEEKMEEPTVGKPAEETIENCQNTDKADETEMEEVRSKSSKDVQQLTSKEQLWQYVKRKSREPVIGLSALLECCCDKGDPIYLCECCSLKIPEEDIISHVTGVDHQQMYLGGLQKLPPSPVGIDLGKTIRHLSVLFEEDNGYGDAQVVDLDEEIYKNISKQTFKSATETVKALQARNDSRERELPSTSALSPVQPVDTSLTIQAQHEVSSVTDDCQVEKMESDDNSEDSEAQLSSVTAAVCVMTETTSKTTEVPPELTEVKTEVTPDTTVGQTVPSCTKATASKLRATATPNSSYSATFKSEQASKHSKTSKSGATVKMIKTSVQSEKAEASAKTNADVAPNIPTHAARHLSALMSVRPAESSHTSASQTKTSKGPPKVALEKVKEMLRHRGSHVSSFTTNDIADVSRVVSASPCEASTPEDETKSTSKEEGSLNRSEPEAKDIHLCLTLNINHPDTIGTSSVQDVKRAAAKVKTPQCCADPVAIEEAPEMGQQQERRDPELQDTQKTCPVNFLNLDLVSSAASVNTKLQRQSRSSQKAEHLPTPRTGHRSASQGLPRMSIWKSTQHCSNLSLYLKAKGLSKEPIIGLGFVWECQGKSQNTFFLCESCKEMLFISDICQHVVSDKHQLKYMQSHRPQFLWFLLEEELDQQMKQELLKDLAVMLSEQEHGIDAQVVLLRQDLYEYVRTAPFSEALKLVKKVKEEPSASVPSITLQEKDERQKTGEHHIKNTAVVGIKQRRDLSPLDLNSVSSKAHSVVSPFCAAAECQSPQDTRRTLLTPPELRPPVSQDWRPIPEFEVKEMHSDFPSSSSVSPITSQTMSVSPRDECLPTRKRPAVTPPPQLEGALPAKCTRVSLQPRTESAPEFTPVNPAATSSLLSPEDKDAAPVSDKQDPSTFDWTKFADLLALMRERKSEKRMSTHAACPNNAGTSNSCTDRSSESGMEKSEEANYGQTTLQDETAKKRNRLEKWQKIKGTWENPPSTNSFEGIVSTSCPSVLGYENQLITPNTNSIKSPTRDVVLAEKAKAVSTILPTTSNDDPSDPQHQRTVGDQSVLSTVSQVQMIPCVASKHNPGQVPQPQSNTETDCTSGDHLPIKAIITARPDSSKQQSVGSNAQAYTEVNRGNQFTESFSTVTTVSPSDTIAASGSYGQYRQMAYVTNGQVSGCLSSQAVTGYSTPDNLPVCFGNVYHCEGYPREVFYPSQIYRGQDANGCILATAMPPRLVRLGMQHQYSSWTSATLAAADGSGTNEAASLHTVPFIAEANNSQMSIAVNNDGSNRIAPQVYIHAPVIHSSFDSR